MARQFDVPAFYRSPVVSRVKEVRRLQDPRKKDLSPSVLDFGSVRFKLARHFGFCYGVENAIEIAYRALKEHPDQRIFLLSEMIHNSHVNADLLSRGIQFLRTTNGEQLIPFDTLTSDDIVIIPAFGATLEVTSELERLGVDVQAYNTTCPFVEKVWKRSAQIGAQDYTVVVHGKRYHEETRATVSHAQSVTHVMVVRDLDEARDLARYIRGDADRAFFDARFGDRTSPGFDPEKHLGRIGVVNQTTMLATETSEIAALLRQAMVDRFGPDDLPAHFADTADTLCYATNENQDATRALIADGADVAIIVGGSNSSNTSHLVELCEEEMPTFFVSDASCIESASRIRHFDIHAHEHVDVENWLPSTRPLSVLLTAGASCPDSLLDDVIHRVNELVGAEQTVEQAMAPFADMTAES